MTRARTLALIVATLNSEACQRGAPSAGEAVDDARPEASQGGPQQRTLRIAPEAIKRSGIRIATVDPVSSWGGLEVPAEVQTESDREAHVSSMVPGQLARVFTSVGDRVEVGTPLAIIRSVALGEARAQAARARANVEVAQANFLRQEELKREGIGAERQYLEARAELRRAEAEQSAAERALEVYGRGGRGSEVTLKSPIAGRVISRHASVGEVVGPSDVLFEVTDIVSVWIVGHVYQQHASKVQEGARAIFTLQSYPDRTFSGVLDYVAPALDERSRALPVRMTLENPDGALRPGSFGTLSITPAEQREDQVPAVSERALQRLGEETVVFVPGTTEGEFSAVPVVVLSVQGGVARLKQGLTIGDRYVADGAFVLKSELKKGELSEGHSH